MARKKRGRKQAKRVLRTIRKAPKVKKASKPVRKAIKKAISSNKGKRLKITKKEIRKIVSKGATRKQVQKIRKVANKSKKLRISKKVDTKKEVRRTFKKAKAKTSQRPSTIKQAVRRAGKDGKITKKEIKRISSQFGNKGAKKITGKIRAVTKGKDIKLPEKGLRKIVKTGKRKKGIDINKNVITPDKVKGKGWNPGRVEDSARSQWSDKFKDYRGPKRIKVKRDKLPSRLGKYSIYGKKTGEYKGFDTKRYMKGVRKDLRQRYKAKGGMIQDKDKINRMIKRDGPKADFNVKPKYSKTMDKLRDQLGGNVDYKKTLGSVTQSLGKEPKVKAGDLKESGMSLLKPRTTEDTAVPMTSTVKTEPPKKKKSKK